MKTRLQSVRWMIVAESHVQLPQMKYPDAFWELEA